MWKNEWRLFYLDKLYITVMQLCKPVQFPPVCYVHRPPISITALSTAMGTVQEIRHSQQYIQRYCLNVQ